jgi:hypothetical protein
MYCCRSRWQAGVGDGVAEGCVDSVVDRRVKLFGGGTWRFDVADGVLGESG